MPVTPRQRQLLEPHPRRSRSQLSMGILHHYLCPTLTLRIMSAVGRDRFRAGAGCCRGSAFIGARCICGEGCALRPAHSNHEVQEAVLALAAGALRAEHAHAWSTFDRAWPAVERFVRARLTRASLSVALLQDCGQNVFARVWAFRLNYRGASEGEFWKWIRQICDNERRRIQERSARAAAHEVAPDPSEVSLTSPITDGSPNEAMLREAVVALRECVGRLPPDGAGVIRLLYGSPALSERAAAEVLGVSASTVHKLKVDALERLSRCMESRGFE